MTNGYAIIVGFVAALLIGFVHRFEPNRMLARVLIALVFVTSALVIAAKLGRDADAAVHRESASDPTPVAPLPLLPVQ